MPTGTTELLGLCAQLAFVGGVQRINLLTAEASSPDRLTR